VRRDLGICRAKASERPQCSNFGCGTIKIALWLGMNCRSDWEVPPLDPPDASISFCGVPDGVKRCASWFMKTFTRSKAGPLEKQWSPITSQPACFGTADKGSLNAERMHDNGCCYEGREALTVISAGVRALSFVSLLMNSSTLSSEASVTCGQLMDVAGRRQLM
jgi:hypothetical protein